MAPSAAPPDSDQPRVFGWAYTLITWGGLLFCIALTVWLFWTLFVHTASGTSRGLSVENSKATQTAVYSAMPTSTAGPGMVAFPPTCAACHVIPMPDGSVTAGAVCPDLTHIATLAAERIAAPDYTGSATTVEAYILESLTDANAYIVPPAGNGGKTTSSAGPDGRPVSLMPQAILNQMPQAQKEAIAAYLASLE
jgi:hypothetical protein